MRVESDKQTRNGGWLHRFRDPIPFARVRQAIVQHPPDLKTMWRRWMNQTDLHHLDGFGMSLGVDTDALRSIGCAWSGQAWAFPMKDAEGRIIGIRLRNETHKWAVKGSRSGLFIPSDYPFNFDGTLYIVEGPTDLAAALTLGLYAVGRPACLGQEEMILEYIRTQKARRVVLVADNDDPGLRGAARLQSTLPISSCVWTPPTKDIREFLKLGGKGPMIDACIKDTVWTRATGRQQAA